MTWRTVPCPVCGTKGGSVVDSRRTDFGQLTNTLCPACGMVWVQKRPLEQAYLAFYRSNYTSKVYGLEETPEKIHDVLRWRTRRSLEKISYFPKAWKRGMRVLEIGAGTGAFLAALRDRFGCRVWGIEPSPAFVRVAERHLHVPMYKGTYKEWLKRRPAGFPKRFDCIVMDQILEHMLEPRDFLASLHSLLSKQGQIFISVPNIAAPKDPSKKFFIFEHVSSFSPFPLALLLLSAGFKPTAIRAERPGSLQIMAAPFGSLIPMLSATDWSKPLTLTQIRSGFRRL